MATIDDVCDYIITKSSEAGLRVNLLKLQKILYYAQAWHLAFEHKPLFEGRFQAWVHGPVNRETYDRFRATKNLYSDITTSDRRPSFSGTSLNPDERTHVDSVIEAYGGFTGSQLEELTHREEPWIQARGFIDPAERCETLIDEKLMGDYYRRLSSSSESEKILGSPAERCDPPIDEKLRGDCSRQRIKA